MIGGGRLAQGRGVCEGRWKSGRIFAMVRAMDLDVLRQVSEEFIPFNKLLGVRVVVLERGRAVAEIPFREELIGDPIKRVLHGGVISALADTAGGMTVWSSLMNPELRISTIDLRIDYLRPGQRETLVAEGTTLRVGRSVGVADIRLYQPSAPADTVATGRGVYVIKAPRSGPASRR